MTVMNCVFLDRSSVKAGMEMIKKGNSLLKEQVNVAIFPEGTRSVTGEVAEFKAGSLKIATRTNSPIVPVTINNSYKIMPSGLKMLKGEVVITIHQLVTHNQYSTLKPQELNDMVEEVIKNQVKS